MDKSNRLIWRIKKGADRRFRSGHPWVYSNELQTSPKGTPPGAVVEVHDAGGLFLAAGYANPQSLISFRTLSRDASERDTLLSAEWFEKKFRKALELRAELGWDKASHRLCFGEGDGIPGLIVDRYLLVEPADERVFCVQAHTAGIDSALPAVIEALKKLDPRARIVLRNDLSIRKLDGLADEPARQVHGQPLPERTVAKTASGTELEVDFIQGQKTGLFLDQSANQLQAVRLLEPWFDRLGKKSPPKILDLFCYVGAWSSAFAKTLCGRGEYRLLDASSQALEWAERNVRRAGAENVESAKVDVLSTLDQLDERYDVVVCDPPALIQGRKNIPAGTHEYYQLNSSAMKRVRPGGYLITCSCSGLLDEEKFSEILARSAKRAGRAVTWVARGGFPPDHPVRLEFPEGRYLKCWMGRVD